MHSPIYTALFGLLAAITTVSAAPAPVPNPGPGPVILAEYTTYSGAHCSSTATSGNIGPDQCQALPVSTSINATFSDAQGRECKLNMPFLSPNFWPMLES